MALKDIKREKKTNPSRNAEFYLVKKNQTS